MSRQPTLADVPGILLRTTLRLAARIILALAGIFFVGGGILAYSALLLCTWRSPRSPRIQLVIQILTDGYALWQSLQQSESE